MVHGREYRPYSIISFHRDRSRSAERLGCVPLRWKFWSSERKTVDRGDTSPWKRVGCSYPTSKRWEANRLSKRPHSAGVFLSKIFLSNRRKRLAPFIWELFMGKIYIYNSRYDKKGSRIYHWSSKIEFYDNRYK